MNVGFAQRIAERTLAPTFIDKMEKRYVSIQLRGIFYRDTVSFS